ncbi:MAG TPA: DUF952 domain-containing protein [Anaerolineales bacterium]|nr:DUF952 domain-containing protein [Anaerolineales bacterium]
MIFHIADREDWEAAQAQDEYTHESLGTEGFIHCSTLAQVIPVANLYYKGESGLVLLAIEPTLLSSTLKWEPPAEGTPPPGVPEGDQFPHVYGPINLDAVVNVIELISHPDGTFTLPAL